MAKNFDFSYSNLIKVNGRTPTFVSVAGGLNVVTRRADFNSPNFTREDIVARKGGQLNVKYQSKKKMASSGLEK